MVTLAIVVIGLSLAVVTLLVASLKARLDEQEEMLWRLYGMVVYGDDGDKWGDGE